jgi:Peptidase family M1 domain
MAATVQRAVNWRMHAGDLVTLPWWTQLWLNEGFATYFESMGAAYLFNEYNSTSSWPNDDGILQPHPGALNYMHSFPIDVLDVALRYARTLLE